MFENKWAGSATQQRRKTRQLTIKEHAARAPTKWSPKLGRCHRRHPAATRNKRDNRHSKRTPLHCQNDAAGCRRTTPRHKTNEGAAVGKRDSFKMISAAITTANDKKGVLNEAHRPPALYGLWKGRSQPVQTQPPTARQP